jgi:hypothetical protein
MGYAREAPGPGITTAGVAGWSDHLGVRGVYGIAPTEGVRGEIIDYGGAFGVLGMGSDPMDPVVRGVYGEVPNSIAVKSYGVHGRSLSNDEESAGVLAEGNGTAGPGGILAAALEIRNGAIRVSGTERTAGSLVLPGSSWLPIVSCDGGDFVHPHIIGHYTELLLVNDLITVDSIILLTVEVGNEGPGVVGSYHAHVKNYAQTPPGSRAIRVNVMGDPTGGACNGLPASVSATLRIHYLIINPSVGP